jgi:hypothetical protein
MRRKNPAGIQQQFMVLLETTEKAEADNLRLQSAIDDLKTQLNKLNSTCVKKKMIQTPNNSTFRFSFILN